MKKQQKRSGASAVPRRHSQGVVGGPEESRPEKKAQVIHQEVERQVTACRPTGEALPSLPSQAEVELLWIEASARGVAYGELPYREAEQNGEEPQDDQSIDLGGGQHPELDEPEAEIVKAADAVDTVALYLNQVGQVPLLAKEDEVTLAKRIERGRKARAQLALGEIPPGQRAKLENLAEEGLAAFEHLILANSRLVVSIAKRYQGRGVPLLDLIQEGHIGLMRAAKKFEYRLGYKFSTYATWWIRQAVVRAVGNLGRTIRVPIHTGGQINQLERLFLQLTQDLEREPSSDEMAEALGVTHEKLRIMIRAAQQPISLESSIDDEEAHMLADQVQDRATPAPEEMAIKAQLEEDLRRLLDTLSTRERLVLEFRYGLRGRRGLTLKEIGQKLGVTRERARQIESQALWRLRQPRYSEEFRDYFSD